MSAILPVPGIAGWHTPALQGDHHHCCITHDLFISAENPRTFLPPGLLRLCIPRTKKLSETCFFDRRQIPPYELFHHGHVCLVRDGSWPGVKANNNNNNNNNNNKDDVVTKSNKQRNSEPLPYAVMPSFFTGGKKKMTLPTTYIPAGR